MNNTKNFFDPVNLGNPDERTVKNLAELIIKYTDSNSKIIYTTLPSDDPSRRKPDITAASEILGWSPKVSIEDGLKMTIEYFKQKSGGLIG